MGVSLCSRFHTVVKLARVNSTCPFSIKKKRGHKVMKDQNPKLFYGKLGLIPQLVDNYSSSPNGL